MLPELRRRMVALLQIALGGSLRLHERKEVDDLLDLVFPQVGESAGWDCVTGRGSASDRGGLSGKAGSTEKVREVNPINPGEFMKDARRRDAYGASLNLA